MLSREERDGMLAEARDARRRELLRARGWISHSALAFDRYLSFLSAASALLAATAALPRRRPLPGGRYLL